MSTTNDHKRKGRERCLFFARPGLASYLCRVCPMCISLSRLRGWYPPPPQWIAFTMVRIFPLAFTTLLRQLLKVLPVCATGVEGKPRPERENLQPDIKVT